MKVWSQQHQRWYYSWARIYWKRICLFASIVWREYDDDLRLPASTAWVVSCGLWSAEDTHYRFKIASLRGMDLKEEETK